MTYLLSVRPKTGENIEFPQVLGKQLETEITLTNLSPQQTLAFKMKVNSPKTYLVRPSGGVLAPNESFKVQIILQALSEKVPAGQHRFLIHSAVVPAGTTNLTREDWPRLQEEKGIEEQLLSVVFVPESSITRETAAVKPTTTGTPQHAPAAGPTSPSASAEDLKAKYNELWQKKLTLEKEIRTLEMEKKGGGSAKGAVGTRKFSMVQMIAAVLVSLLVVKIPSWL